jgi:hypothetical protein
VLLATKGVLTRPWCLIELLEATRKKIPIVVVEIAGRGFDRTEARAFVTELEAEMAAPGLNLLHTQIGPDLAELKDACLQILDVYENFLVLDPHAGDSELVAMMKDMVEKLAQQTRREIKWERGPGQLGMGKGLSRSNTGMRQGLSRSNTGQSDHEGQARGGRRNRRADGGESFQLEASGLLVKVLRKMTLQQNVVQKANSLTRSLGLDSVTNTASAVFVCCSRSDALNHARVLRSELSVRLDRGCAIGGGASTAKWIAQSEAVVVLLTKALVTDPDALFEIWTALSLDVPIITVQVAGMYDFAYAAAKLANLPLALERAGEGTDQGLSTPGTSQRLQQSQKSPLPQRSPRSDRSLRLSLLSSQRSDISESEKAAARLKGRLPDDADVVSVGKTIYERFVQTPPRPSMLPTDPCTSLV